ncbi:MAG: hypothetical protein COC24_010330 [Alphaproteobacteria bacterium]|nr:hypothetical protein [Alphaproteobacteria bacterium]
MTNILIKTLSILALMTATSTYAQEKIMVDQKASYIEIIAAENQGSKLAQFLTNAAPLVKQTEPETNLWFALQASDDKHAIFDIFLDEDARNTHYSGAVANALKENASKLVKGGWLNGVVDNINNSTVLSANQPSDLYSATTATYIKLTAAQGQSEELAALLTAAGQIVSETEPKTLFWVALQLDSQNFAIYDIFADETGRTAHFAGQVAGLLKEKAATLVQGGWDDGVVANISNYKILAIN